MEWFGPALSAIANREAALVVVILVLILVVDRRLMEVVKSNNAVNESMRRSNAHTASRMDEIRGAMWRIAERLGADLSK